MTRKLNIKRRDHYEKHSNKDADDFVGLISLKTIFLVVFASEKAYLRGLIAEPIIGSAVNGCLGGVVFRPSQSQ